MKTIIHNATIVNEGRMFQGSVVIEDQMIQEVIEGGDDSTQSYDQLIDAEGLYLFPGVIDDHVHFREPGLTYKADIASESRTAAAGGVTSFMDMPNTVPQTTTIELLEDKFEIGRQNSRVNYSFYFGATNDNNDLLCRLNPERVPGVKVFMGSSTGNMLVNRVDSLLKLFQTSPLLIMAHCEDTDIINHNIKFFRKKYKGQNDFPVRYHSRIRSVDACYTSSALAVKLANETGARLHIAHVSTAKELSLFDNSLNVEEKKITAEAVIAHLMFSTEDYDRLGTKIKCNPAIKTPEDRAALREALNTGHIDVVATESPCNPAGRQAPLCTSAQGAKFPHTLSSCPRRHQAKRVALPVARFCPAVPAPVPAPRPVPFARLAPCPRLPRSHAGTPRAVSAQYAVARRRCPALHK